MSRAYCFTTYYEPQRTLRKWHESHPSCRALVCQVEICPSTNRPHIQGFVRFDKPLRHKAVLACLGLPYAHFETPKGTDQQNITYCSDRTKQIDESIPALMFGEFSTQGKRSDLKKVFQDGMNGTLEFNEDTLTVYARYPRFFDKCKSLHKPPSFRKVEVFYIYGPTDTGKTRSAYEFDPELYRLFSTKPEWWDGYDGESTVLIDDYRGDMDTSRMLQILDGYPMRVPIKGSSQWLFATTIFITSNYPPDYFWKGANLDAIMRRITKIHDSNEGPQKGGVPP